MHATDLTEGLEQESQIAFRRLEIHVANKKTFHVASPGILMRRGRELPVKVSLAWTGGFESAEVKNREGRRAATREFRQFNVASMTITRLGTNGSGAVNKSEKNRVDGRPFA